VLYLAESGQRHDRIADRWRQSYPPLSLRTETLTSLVYELHERIEGPSARLPDAIDQRVLEYSLDAIVDERPWLSTQSHAPASLVDAFDRRFARFQNVGLDTPDRVNEEFSGSTLPPRIRDTTVAAYKAYYRQREAVLEPWHVTYSQAFDTVATADIEALAPHVDAIIVSGFFDLGDVEQRLLESLFEAFPTAVLRPTFSPSGTAGVDTATETMRELCDDLDFKVERVDSEHGSSALQRVAESLYRNQPPAERHVPDELEWRELPPPEREVRYVARDIRAKRADATEPLDIGVVVPGLHAYDDYLEDVFDTFDLPYTVETGTALTETFVGSAVSDLIALSETNPRAADLTSLVTNPVVGSFDVDLEAAVVAAERRVDAVRVSAVQPHLPESVSAAVETLLDRLEPLQEENIATAVETLRDELDRLGIANAIDRDGAPIDTGQEQAALEQMRAILDSFDIEPTRAADLSPAAALRRAVEGASLNGHNGGPEHITVLNHRDAKEFAFDDLYIVGLTADHFPSTRQHAAFFEQMVDAHPILDVLDDRVRDRYLFATLLANADSVTLTTPSTDPDSTAVVRSPVLDELNRVTGIEPTTGVDSRIGSREDLQRALSPRDDRQEATDAAGERGEFSVAQTIRTDRGIQCASERAEHGLSQHDGMLDPETVAAVYPEAEREPYSASRIERYVNCGFQFYMEHVLGLEDDDDIERTPDPLEAGTYIHDTFERFYAALQSAPGEGVALREHDRSDLEAHMLAVALDELADADFEYSGLFYERWLEQLFAGLGAPDENPHYGDQRPHGGVERGLFSRFIEREYERDGDALPAWFEAPFGAGLYDEDEDEVEPFDIELPNGNTVEFRGYIDRVDVGVGDGDTTMQLFDYKTGYAPSMTKTTEGTTFQLPLYLLAAEQVLADELDEAATLSATYYQTKPPNRLKEPRGIESKFDTQSELRRFLDDVIPDRLATITTAIEQGRFHTTLLPQREAGCEYCSYQRSCDVRPHQRRDRVDLLDDDAETYVPVRATPRDFEDEFGGEADD
jgi:ATP-dependent helicase/nuclease subunit B